MRVHENSNLACNYDSVNPDENVAYYQAKLLEQLNKFKEFLPTEQKSGEEPGIQAKAKRKANPVEKENQHD